MELSARYSRTVHFLYPFLVKPSHTETIERVHKSPENSPLGLFQAFMVSAIAAALDLSRHVKVHLPVEGYYIAAMRHVDAFVVTIRCADCKIYFDGQRIPIVNYQCLATVVDLELQRHVHAFSSFRISMRERSQVSWVAYTFYRVICTMMGRPIGLRDGRVIYG